MEDNLLTVVAQKQIDLVKMIKRIEENDKCKIVLKQQKVIRIIFLFLSIIVMIQNKVYAKSSLFSCQFFFFLYNFPQYFLTFKILIT